ncbi:MAG TPA: hypothetical protein VMT38_10975 [Terracidiphilus sp.]|nr:hypothetical protein [Terracidiphilus sp.]
MTLLRTATIVAIIFCLLQIEPAHATTYYVDYSKGSDGNAGTSKSAPWKHAPGMNGASGNASSTAINPGDSVILKGCVTWPNAAFSWTFPYAGSNGNPIYVGVDRTWWDSSVSGCSTAWNRPVFNLGNAAPSDSLDRIIILQKSYVTYDNFEMTNIAALPSSGNGQTDALDWYDNSEVGVIVENFYIHDWINPFITVGTGNISSGATTITNFVPYSGFSSPASSWTASGLVKLQIIPQGSVIPIGNNSPTLTGVSGSNPYTLTFSNTAGGASTNCTGCVVQVGGDFFKASGGVEGQCSGCVMLNNVIDGSDTAEVQINPYLDCGATESNNNFCLTSSTAGWRQPNIWRGNVIRFVQSAFVGECTEWSNNLIEGIRLGTDPTGHTNGIECLDETASNNVYYNNVERYTNNPNSSVPGGQWTIGLLNQVSPMKGYTDYVFNNLTYDTLQNVPWGLYPSGTGCCGTIDMFNNTSDGGGAWTSEKNDITNPCPSGFQSCNFINNHLISNIASSALTSCGSNCSDTSNLVQTVSVASGLKYAETLMYPFAPSTSTSSTMGKGTNEQSFCAAITAFNTTAGTACQSDTTFAVAYDTTKHAAGPFPARMPMPRPASGLGGWSIGAYQVPEPAPPTNLTGVAP